MNRSRPPAVAGSFYPSDGDDLRGLIDQCFHTSPLGPHGRKTISPTLIAGMVPHAGYVYSGPCAAHLFAILHSNIHRVVLLGVNHRGKGHRAALSPAEVWETPLGRVQVDVKLRDSIESRVDFVKTDEHSHRQEHSIEVQLPFLQQVLERFTFVPLSLSFLSLEECAELGAAVADACREESGSGTDTIVLASSDLSHYLSPEKTDELDKIALEKVLAMDAEGLLRVVEEKEITMCGVLPTAVMLYAASALGAKNSRLLKQCHSGDVTPMTKVVGYASVAIEH
ncbi:MAG: AmmeMemoRadiSam system protein B [Deltaproteobacteria bacterium]|nr:AmmeMemoRadiSam system protein B [Deltaproteobacteria bacterium]